MSATSPAGKELLRQLPSVTQLLDSAGVRQWFQEHPRELVVRCCRDALEQVRQEILADQAGRCGAAHTSVEYLLGLAQRNLEELSQPRVRCAINATGIILHTGLGRAVWPASVVDSVLADLKGYVTLAVDRAGGQRRDRDRQVEHLLTELTGAEAATVVNNNAAATVLVLAGLAAGREVVVSRGQLIEIGGSFRLPEIMALSGARMVEVGTTNRTHLGDYEQAITGQTACLLRVHPSNYRIVGFAAQPELSELAELAHARGVPLVDDLGAGALVGLEQFGLPHEPMVQESIAAGADVALFSADKLIGASQGGIIVGRKDLIDRLRKHPLARAVRIDKSCLMVLERTLMLFRDPLRLPQTHPTYRMLATPIDRLQVRAEALAAAIRQAAPAAQADVAEGEGFLGSGSLPQQALPDRLVVVQAANLDAAELARRLREDAACVFGRVVQDRCVLNVRTITDEQAPLIAQAIGRAIA